MAGLAVIGSGYGRWSPWSSISPSTVSGGRSTSTRSAVRRADAAGEHPVEHDGDDGTDEGADR